MRYNRAEMAKTGRNEACHCGSGKKFKHCCEGKRTSLPLAGWITLGAIGLAVAVLAYFLVAAATDDGSSSARTCPPGQVWSAAHGHCH